MKRKIDERTPYRQPRAETFEAGKIVESLGPVSAGTSGSAATCFPMIEDCD